MPRMLPNSSDMAHMYHHYINLTHHTMRECGLESLAYPLHYTMLLHN